jgi:uncharacterized protein
MAERVTLITGASTGIGAELARIFAANDHRVVLVARRVERLSALADEIVSAGGAPPIVIACDLERADACDILAGALSAQDVEVEFVVNNAGFGMLGEACVLDRGQQIGMVDVNVRALTDLSLRFSESIIRHGGGILNVASIASYLPGPCMAVYYASKAYVLSFTEALHQELRPKGVRVTALCPGPVPTEFQERAGVQPGFDSRILNMSAAAVALAGYRGLMAGKRVVLPGLAMKIIPLLLRFAPRPIVLAAASRIQSKR